MFTVLNSYRDANGVLLYAVQDFSSGADLEIITEDELKLLVDMSLQIKDINDNLVTLSGDTLNLSVEDITEQINEDIEANSSDDEDDDIYGIYGDYDEEESEEESEEEEYEEDDMDFSDYDAFDDLLEEDDPEGSVVSKLYELLTEEQIVVLRRYYLWFSQRLFEDAQKDPTMGFKNKARMIQKKNSLNNLRGDGDWRYAGFLDTGSKRAGYTCSLGHPIRYMHLAWDITKGDIETSFFGEDYNLDYESVIASNDCIIFGIKCIGDFFEVDSDCIKALQRAQRDSLKDMAIMYDIYESGNVQEVKDSFKLLDEVLARVDRISLMRKDNPIVPLSVSSFYDQFRKADLIPPKSLIQEIRSCLVGWTDGKHYFSNKWTGELRYPYSKFTESLGLILGKRYKEEASVINFRDIYGGRAYTFVDCLTTYIYIMFTYEICGYYKYNADTNKDEGGKSKPVRYTFDMHYKHTTENLFSDFEYSLTFLKDLFEIARISCKYERENRTQYTIDVYRGYGDTEDSIEKHNIFDSYNSVVRCLPADYDKEHGTNLESYVSILPTLSNLKTVRPLRNTNWVTVNNDKVSARELVDVLVQKDSDFNTLFEDLKKWLEVRNTTQLNKYKAEKKLEEEEKERKRQEEERILAELEAKKLKEQEEKRIEEEEKRKLTEANSTSTSSIDASSVDSPKKVVEYLSSMDLSAYKKSDKFALDVLDTLKRSGKEPTDRQFQYIQPFFEKVSGKKYEGVGKAPEKVKLFEKPDIQKAILWVNRNTDTAEELGRNLGIENLGKTLQIIASIEKWGTISDRQMKYAEIAVKIYEARP